MKNSAEFDFFFICIEFCVNRDQFRVIFTFDLCKSGYELILWIYISKNTYALPD